MPSQITTTGSVWWCHLVSEPTVRMRSDTFPTILPPPPAPSVRSPLAANMKEAKVREDRLERCGFLTVDAVTVEFSEWHQFSVFTPAPQFLLRQTYGLGVRLCFYLAFHILHELNPNPQPLTHLSKVLSSGVKTTKLSGNEVCYPSEGGISLQLVIVFQLLIIFRYHLCQGKEWFAGDCNRKTAEALLLRVNKVQIIFNVKQKQQ